MKLLDILDVVAKVLPAATNFRLIGLVAGIAVSLGGAAIVGVPAVVRLIQHRAEQKQTVKLTHAAETIAIDATALQASHAREIVRIDTTTREAEHDVLTTIGADERAPDVARALHDALCLSDAYRAEPDCAALRGDPEGVGPARGDAGRDPAGGR